MKTYNIRVRAEYTGYYKIEAKSIDDAEAMAKQQLFDEMNDEVDGYFDFEEFARAVDYDQNMINNMINLLRAAPGNTTEESATELSTVGQISNALELLPLIDAGITAGGNILYRIF